MIYIVLPLYNEARNITRVIADIRRVLSGQNIRIIAVNDGSKDKTLKILKKLKKKDMTIISSVINMNVGAVFSAGIHEALRTAGDSDVLVIMEGDGTSSVELLPRLITEIKNNRNNIVIASRLIGGGGYRRFPLVRRVTSVCANWLMQLYFPRTGIKDYTIFYRAYRIGIIRKTIQALGTFGLIQSIGFAANAELLVKLTLFTDKVKEIPFVYDYGHKKGNSKIGIIRTIGEYIIFIRYLMRIEHSVDTVKRKC